MPGHHRRTWVLAAPVLVWLFVYAGVWTTGKVAGFVGLNPSANSGRWEDNVTALFASLPVLACLWLWLRFFEGRGLRDIGFDRPARGVLGRGFAKGFVIGCALLIGVVVAGLLTGAYTLDGPGAWQGPDMVWLTAALLACLGTVVQACVTEALWRGFLLDAVQNRWGMAAAVAFNVLASLIIQGGILTFNGGFWRSPEAFLGGLNMAIIAGFLSLYVLREGAIWGACGIHTGWNLMMGFGLGLPVDGGNLRVTPLFLDLSTSYAAPTWLSGGYFGPDGSVLMTMAALVATVLVFTGRVRLNLGGRSAQHDDDAYDRIDDD